MTGDVNEGALLLPDRRSKRVEGDNDGEEREGKANEGDAENPVDIPDAGRLCPKGLEIASVFRGGTGLVPNPRFEPTKPV